jgi:tetratricopeptide (TPR) repeat protein
MTRDDKQALADFTQAVALDPQLAEGYHHRGRVYGRYNHYERALADFNRALALDPRFAAAYADRGFIYEKQGQYAKALADYTHALALNAYADDLVGLRPNLEHARRRMMQLSK